MRDGSAGLGSLLCVTCIRQRCMQRRGIGNTLAPRCQPGRRRRRRQRSAVAATVTCAGTAPGNLIPALAQSAL
eukprot:6201094-Pleurochrysis_carterae.AAC.2